MENGSSPSLLQKRQCSTVQEGAQNYKLLEKVMLGVACWALLKEDLNSLKVNSFLMFSEKKGSLNWEAQKVNTEGCAGAELLSIALKSVEAREASVASPYDGRNRSLQV